MTDIRNVLASKYLQKGRFSNFGSVITEVKIAGFRGVKATIDFEFPVTALTGFNGSGKSTVGQLLLCGYKKLSTALSAKRFYVKDFFPVSVADPSPFDEDASITYNYQTDRSDAPQELTISRATKEWSGYKRQPERNTEYVGFTVYIPKVERRDLSISSAVNLELTERTEIEEIKNHVSQILGSAYDSVYFQGVSAKFKDKLKQGELGVATRYGASYSENNMGFGEGRVVYTVRLLETCPEQSLIVLEEPETSLHEYAQFEFAKYLMEVASRRRHQIVFSTHSSIMMDALPPAGRKLLVRSANGVEVFNKISSSRIRTALSGGERGHTIICVEDNFAQSMLREILRRYDREMLDCVEILPFGDAGAVVQAMKVLNKSGIGAVAVRDADTSEDKSNSIFKLPGEHPPEKEVFLSQASKSALLEIYGFDLDTYLATHKHIDHHDYSKIVADSKGYSREVIESDCIRAFLDDRGEEWAKQLCIDLRNKV